MRLSAELIKNFCGINMFGFTDQWMIRAGDPNTLYFQLVDLDQDNGQDGCSCPLRYIPGIGLTPPATYGVTVTFPSIDDTKTITATAIQADPNDASVWKVNLLSTQLPGSGNVIFSVAEGTAVRTFKVMNGLSVEYPGQDGCC
jgi:hypothetical protein